MASRPFTKEDFAKWNTTTSVFHVPKRLVGKGKIPQLRADFVKAIGADRVLAVQILPNHKVRVQFKSPSIRVRYEINGLSFRGVTLTPFPAYEEVKSVFVDRAPLQMADNYLYEALAPYGRVISVQHLTVRGFPTIKTGTRMVSMSVHTSIPAELKVAGFTLAFRYRGQLPTCYVCQEVGHTAKECPKSRKAARKQPVRKQTGAQSATSNINKPSQQRDVPPSTSQESPASSKPPADLREKLNKAKASEEARKVQPPRTPVLKEVQVAFEKSPRDLWDKLIARRNATSLAPSTQAFDLDLSVSLSKTATSSSSMVTDFGRKVTAKPGKQLEVVVSNPAAAARKQGKSRHVSSSSEESDDSLAEMSATPKPHSKRVKRSAKPQKPSGNEAEGPSKNITDVASLGQTVITEDCLDGSTVIDPIAPLGVEEMEAQSAPVSELPTDSSTVSGDDNPKTFVAEPTEDSVSHSDPHCHLCPPQDIPLPEEVTLEEANSNCGPLTDDDMWFDFESDHSGSDVESSSGASTTSSLQKAAELTEHLLQDAANASHSLEDAATLWQALDKATAEMEDGSSSFDH
ncbi:zinc finger CCHC domain-containing 3-like [Paramuricea clavata]|uniref:Zinc finger CCHC domain-containing 3-like n=1 Tax=Paramuricea clavata TaxID=317549 RepID=A0A7D9JKJ8_PARCT|nr:zinc finger CCHC domain-containing 3-like [Paramuricea clavata]